MKKKNFLNTDSIGTMQNGMGNSVAQSALTQTNFLCQQISLSSNKKSRKLLFFIMIVSNHMEESQTFWVRNFNFFWGIE